MNSLFSLPPECKDENCILRMPEKQDALVLTNLFSLPMSEKQAELMITRYQTAYRQHRELIIAAADRNENQICCLFEIYDIHQNACTIGYRCMPSQMHRHITTNCLSLVLSYLMKCGIETVKAEALKENIASIKVLENNGFRLEHEDDLRKFYVYTESGRNNEPI